MVERGSHRGAEQLAQGDGASPEGRFTVPASVLFKACQGQGLMPSLYSLELPPQLPWHPMGRNVSRLLRNLPSAVCPLSLRKADGSWGDVKTISPPSWSPTTQPGSQP